MTCMIKVATPSTHLWYVCLSNMQIPSGIKIQSKRIPLVDLPMIGCNWQQMHDHRRLVRNVLAWIHSKIPNLQQWDILLHCLESRCIWVSESIYVIWTTIHCIFFYTYLRCNPRRARTVDCKLGVRQNHHAQLWNLAVSVILAATSPLRKTPNNDAMHWSRHLNLIHFKLGSMIRKSRCDS